MATLFTHTLHPRINERQKKGPLKIADQLPHKSAVARLNARFGVAVTVAVGSMWAAYLFTLIALVSLPSALKTHDKIIIVSWVAQTFLQLVLLPIIIVGQNVQGAASDKRAQATYDDADAVLHTAIQIQSHLLAQDEAIVSILDHLGIPRPPAATAPA